MTGYNYQKICQDLISDLPQRQKEVILRRFGLGGNRVVASLPPLSAVASGEGELRRETLESIGKSFGITRERIRQIEKDGFLEIKPKIANYQKIFQFFGQYLKRHGGLRRETILLEDLGREKFQAQIYFLLTVSGNFERFAQDEDFYSFWAIDKKVLEMAKKAIDSLSNRLKEIKKPLILKEISSFSDLKFLTFYLEISKKILRNGDGLYGLSDWPEINPRGEKDKSYLVFKKAGKPLHFSEVARLIEGGALIQTVHNELIRDPRFILVGKGIYALSEWGYYPGEVKDVISKILKENGPLSKEEILKKALSQRLVKENTILLNLSNKKYFFRDSQGKYKINPATKFGVEVKEA